jgi:putative glutamine amidotransferase
VSTPVVGITTYVTDAHWGYWNLEAALIPSDYVNAVAQAGGRPLLVPPSLDGVEETLDALDAVVFTGGSDVDPDLYGEDAHPETFGINRLRDEAELALLAAALERDMPVLGICRGIQVLNVAMGGDLHQHVPELVGHEGHKHDPPGEFVAHDVAVEPKSRLAEMLGERTTVMSHHHQGVKSLAPGLVESARADDGLVEAVEAPDKRFTVGVLWHPEAGRDARLFEGLVAEARRYREERGR